jgi:hypothetical protein
MVDDKELEREKLAFEREKLAFEQEKFDETQKLENLKTWLLFIPLIIAILTIAYSVYSS